MSHDKKPPRGGGADTEPPKKSIKKINAPKPLLICLGAVVAILFLYLCYQLFILAGQALSYYRTEQAKELTVREFSPPSATPAPATATTPPATGSSAPSAPPSAREPDTVFFPQELTQKIADLRKAFDNNDIVGYLKIDNTSVDYPVCYSGDNSFYLDHDVYKKKSSYGALFLDMDNNPAFSDQNNIIYGHNMKSDTMFHAVRYYLNKSFYDRHRYITLVTQYDYTEWEVFAACNTTTDFDYIEAGYSAAGFADLLDQIKKRAAYDTGVPVSVSDKILSLSTCNNVTDDGRIGVFAKLISRTE